jgi:hypothetical protein
MLLHDEGCPADIAGLPYKFKEVSFKLESSKAGGNEKTLCCKDSSARSAFWANKLDGSESMQFV